MTTWTTIPNSAAGVGGIPSGTTITALRDNPVAIAEGATGAPRVRSKALQVALGLLTVTGPAGMGFTGLDGESLIRADIASSGGTYNETLRARYSNDNGATWGSWQTITTFADVVSYFGVLTLNLQTGAYSVYGFGNANVMIVSGTHTVPSAANAFQLSLYAAFTGRMLYGQFYILGGV